MPLKKKKLLYQLLFFILPFIVLSIVSTGVILSLTNNNFFKHKIYRDYRNIIRSSAGEILQYMNSNQHSLESLAFQMSLMNLDSWQKKIALNAFAEANPQFKTVDLVTAKGGKIASSIPEAHRLDDMDRPLFDRALSGKTEMSGVIMSPNSIPFVRFALPVFQLGKIKEVLLAKLDLKAVWDVLEKISIDDTGRVYIMDASGRIIAHTEIDRVIKAQKLKNLEILKKIRSKKTPVEWHSRNNGTEYYNLGIYLPKLEWIVVLNQQNREVDSYLYENAFLAAIITMIICIVAVFFGWRKSRQLLAPVQDLHRQVKAISRGDLDQKITIDTKNEIRELGIAFNEMTDALKVHIAKEMETVKELEHAKNLAILGTASSKMAHEVGNFLNGVNMVLAAFKKEPLSPNGEKILSIIKKDTVGVREYIQKFLQFSKKPKPQFQQERIDLIIWGILEIIGPEIDKKGIKVSLKWDETIPEVSIDPNLINQVFTNLIKNSMEAISGKGVITIKGKMENEDIVISVSDTGGGIAPANVEKIFEPFFSTKGNNGTGLGMAIVKSNVETHGGTIECHSELQKGTSVIVRLPNL